ncbi:hypothetical protein HDE80_004001 [Rhodanobacter sp. A1T4]|nr:hypothetical protein [Rhodanobacter sp. A1T4]
MLDPANNRAHSRTYVGRRYRVISLPFDHTEQPSAVHFYVD